MRARDYTKAAYEVIQGGRDTDAVLRKLKAVLERRGHSRLYPQILRGLGVEFGKHTKETAARVTVGRVSDISRYDLDIEKALIELGGTKEYETTVDTTIIGGFKVTRKDRVIDKSHKKRLITLYRSIIG